MPNAVSLFSGGGGMLRGFTESGFECIFSTDIMADSKKTILKNRLSRLHETRDISTFDRSEIEEIIGDQDVMFW